MSPAPWGHGALHPSTLGDRGLSLVAGAAVSVWEGAGWEQVGQGEEAHREGTTHVELEYCRKPNSSRWPSGHRDCMTGRIPAEVSGAAV